MPLAPQLQMLTRSRTVDCDGDNDVEDDGDDDDNNDEDVDDDNDDNDATDTADEQYSAVDYDDAHDDGEW